MPSLLEVEAAMHAYHKALSERLDSKRLDPGGVEAAIHAYHKASGERLDSERLDPEAVEAAILAYSKALVEQVDPGGGNLATGSEAMYAALKAAEMVRAEELKSSRE